MSRETLRRNAWKWKCGLPEDDPKPVKVDLDELRRAQWCDEFDELRRNRMVLGTLRYGDYKAPNAPKYDRVGSAIKRLQRYQETGNTEFLVDTANMCMIEFDRPHHPKAHFHAVDDGEHAEIIN